jgi:hypothetical protein
VVKPDYLARHRPNTQAVPTEDGRLHLVARCTTCGREGTPHVMLKHMKASRRWRYLGVEVHHWEGYHLWEHQLTGRRYAWPVDKYRAQNSRAVK